MVNALSVFVVSDVHSNYSVCVCVTVVSYPSGADCAADGGRLSAPGFLLLWTDSVGTAHTFSPDQVCV